MEVHHHPKLEKKNFKGYFLEFLMIFLAVTMGFLAENLRESLKHKEEILMNMESLASDLYSDVAFFDSQLRRNEYCCKMTDSLIYLLNDIKNTNDIYYSARVVTANFGYFYSNSKTFEQMKSSGTLRLISKRSLLDSIADYYSSMQWLQNQTELMRMKVDAIHLGNSELFDSRVFHKMLQKTDYGNFQDGENVNIYRPLDNPLLISTELVKINKVCMNYHYFYTTMKFYDKTAKQISQKARELIVRIHSEYNLE